MIIHEHYISGEGYMALLSKRAGGHAPPFPIVQIPHITGSSPLPNPPISGAGMQISHSSVQIPHTTGRFGHWAPQPAKHLPDYQGAGDTCTAIPYSANSSYYRFKPSSQPPNIWGRDANQP
jgi:hypothetical protein